MADRNTEVRYPGPLDAVEVQVPEADRDFFDKRHEIVWRGATLKTTAEQAKQLVEQGWEPVTKTKGGDST